ncbi:ubiquinol-cytochrome c reductase iron-sulfur subunit [Geobacter sp. AOG2]|uniref:QcrA and Rieske domain-containing protein n=1 Tax=Geobacter sp. AOG2 TaxID=1566347 RepID=UPI001CC3F265|nr:Rieske (2Fe-2S) protein [Geobacter sp. AOG2]GFE61873.1 cytochrome b6 [Geobacter sp. AOG2]
MENVPQSRRTFIASLTALFCSALLLRRYLTPRKAAGGKALASVAKTEIPAQGALVFREARVALMRSGDDIYALSLVCTHLGCTVNVAPDGLSCPCHGSRFDRRGMVTQGPADRPLRRMRVEEREGMIEVTAV